MTIFLLLVGAYAYEHTAERRDAKRQLPPGRLIRVGDHRLHLLCQGSGGPTVVIEQGAGAPSLLWRPIQEQIAAFACACIYDRAGYLWSEPVHRPRSVCERAEELYSLLKSAGVPGPYLLVAHSYGGLIVREFALLYPSEVAGLVLIDTPDEPALCRPEVQSFYARMRVVVKVMEVASRFGLPRLLRRIPALRQGLWFVRPDEYAAAADDLASLRHLNPASPVRGQLKDVPLAVLTHGQPFPGPFAVLENGWLASQHRLAALSSRSTFTTAQNSNHMIHLDQPDLVIDAVRQQILSPEGKRDGDIKCVRPAAADRMYISGEDCDRLRAQWCLPWLCCSGSQWNQHGRCQQRRP
jgi:pimeloyl-ACP methyl ester carboxylesterase